MSVKNHLDHSPPFPKHLREKLKTIRICLGLTVDEIAPRVGAKKGSEILVMKTMKIIYSFLYCGIIQSSLDALRPFFQRQA
jgi:hypothetical protein